MMRLFPADSWLNNKINYRSADDVSARDLRIRRFIMGVLAFFGFLFLAVSQVVAAPSGWINSFEYGVQQSKKTKRPLYVVIAREGCSACSQQERIFASRSVSRALSPAIKVRAESAYNPQLTARFAAGGTPTTVIFAPGNYTTPVYQYTGILDREQLLQIGRSLGSM